MPKGSRSGSPSITDSRLGIEDYEVQADGHLTNRCYNLDRDQCWWGQVKGFKCMSVLSLHLIMDRVSLGMSRPKGYPRKMEGSSLPAPWIPCVTFGCTGTILG